MAIRTLQPNEPVPPGEPGRYPDSQGYIRLRWYIGDGDSVEIREHRLVAGALPGEHVHHKNKIKDDNRPENLERLSPEEHADHHGEEKRRPEWASVIERVKAGERLLYVSLDVGINHGNISREMKRLGIPVDHSSAVRINGIEADVLALYHQGIRVKQIAEQLGISRGPVDRVLDEHGLSRFPLGSPPGVHANRAHGRSWQYEAQKCRCDECKAWKRRVNKIAKDKMRLKKQTDAPKP